ncbi:MAG: hypothetical protein UZ22_OP11002000613 [Microgenomates bacterium OLB23]|nr:MAG: hypothetical protein UZ22_OP11002000613 [Microgenomates bacterium OLB23]
MCSVQKIAGIILVISLMNGLSFMAGTYYGQQQQSEIIETYPTSVPMPITTTYISPQPVITDRFINTAPVAIYSISPASGPVGTKISIKGIGFTLASNTIVFGLAEPAMYPNYQGSADGTELEFRVPEKLLSGYYNLYISNENGTSNVATFTITPGTTTAGKCSSDSECPPRNGCILYQCASGECRSINMCNQTQ